MLYSAMFSANHDDCVEDSPSIIVQIRRLAVMIMYSDVLRQKPPTRGHPKIRTTH